jgi:hypothetical protein
MKFDRRRFMGTALAGGLAARLSNACGSSETRGVVSETRRADYARLDEILKQPVLKKVVDGKIERSGCRLTLLEETRLMNVK